MESGKRERWRGHGWKGGDLTGRDVNAIMNQNYSKRAIVATISDSTKSLYKN